MPRYLVKRDTLFVHLGRVVKAGEEIDIDWPKSPDGTSSEPKTLGLNLELVEPDDGGAGEAKAGKPKRGA